MIINFRLEFSDKWYWIYSSKETERKWAVRVTFDIFTECREGLGRNKDGSRGCSKQLNFVISSFEILKPKCLSFLPVNISQLCAKFSDNKGDEEKQFWQVKTCKNPLR